MSMDHLEIIKAIATKEQPRHAANGPNCRALPHADPICQHQSSLLEVLHLDCRLLIWEHVLRPSETRIERWRPPTNGIFVSPEDIDTDCFPYRITTAGAEKTEKPLNLLLCCRQLYLEGISILYSTTFVFEMPLDLYAFQVCVSPKGLANVKGLIIALGQIDWPGSGPFFSYDTDTKHPNGSLHEWENAIQGLEKMTCLQELQVWLGHRHVQTPASSLRPWKAGQGNPRVEQRHDELFNLFGIVVNVPNFTVHLTWMPEDLLSQRQWPFRVELHTKDEMMRVMDEMPEKTEPDVYDW